MTRNTLIVLAVLLGGGAAEAQPAEADALLDPGWSDPFFADYLADRSAQAALTEEAIEFSLPVLGFPDAGEEGDPSALGELLGERLAAAIPAWPACARPEPEVVTIPAEPDDAAGLELGTWFTSTYDFGCLQIVIEGDRNRPDRALVATPEVLESGAVEISRHDENAGFAIDGAGNTRSAQTALDAPPAGEVLVSYARGNLVYGVVVSCTRAAGAFCADNGALRALVGELAPVAGRPSR